MTKPQPKAPLRAEQHASKEAPRCGALECRLYPTAEAALEAVLKHDPLILAIGEAHAQRGSEGIASATRRFTEELLPRLQGRASDIVLELMVADGACGGSEKKAAEAQKPVVKQQAQGNQNEFLTLGKQAKELGIRPHVLRPSCKDYRAVANAGRDGIVQMLTMIADLSASLLSRILARNERSGIRKMALAYGGAMHNDLSPRVGRESWSFGPRLAQHTEQRYIELDLIVPEFIKDNDSWRALAWHPHFDATAHPDQVTLFNPRPGSYVLIFARSRPSK